MKTPKEKKVRRLVTLDSDLDDAAKATGNRSGLINDLLRKWLKRGK